MSDWRRIHIDEIRAWLALRRDDVELATGLVAGVDATCRRTGYVRGRVLRTVADRTRSALAVSAG